jgi:hypothetical protein
LGQFLRNDDSQLREFAWLENVAHLLSAEMRDLLLYVLQETICGFLNFFLLDDFAAVN